MSIAPRRKLTQEKYCITACNCFSFCFVCMCVLPSTNIHCHWQPFHAVGYFLKYKETNVIYNIGMNIRDRCEKNECGINTVQTWRFHLYSFF